MAVTLNVLEHPAAEAETAPPLLVAHGLFGSARNFNTLGKKLATNRRVVLVDMRNHGDSEWDGDVRYPSMADDLAGVIDAHCNGAAVLLGHSMGGKASMAAALLHPEKVAALIVADIAPVAYGHSHLSIVEAMLTTDLSGVSRRSQGDALMADAIPDPMLRSFILQNLVIDEGVARWRLNAPALKAGMPDLLTWPSSLAGKAYPGPVLAVYGGNSEYMSQAHAGTMTDHFPNLVLHEIAGAGHWLHADKPAEFLAAVTEFLAPL